MLPSTLALASLRQTRTLRRHTGTNRRENEGRARIREAFMSGTQRAVTVSAASVAQLASGQLDEKVLEIRRPMQIAHAGAPCKVGEHRLRVIGIAERCLAGDLDALREAPRMNFRPR